MEERGRGGCVCLRGFATQCDSGVGQVTCADSAGPEALTCVPPENILFGSRNVEEKKQMYGNVY